MKPLFAVYCSFDGCPHQVVLFDSKEKAEQAAIELIKSRHPTWFIGHEEDDLDLMQDELSLFEYCHVFPVATYEEAFKQCQLALVSESP